MIGRLALRTIGAHPWRTAVLAAGFGVGVSVMAILLGIAQVVLEQAQSPLLVGGGDLVVTGTNGRLEAARLLMSGTLSGAPFAGALRAVSPTSQGTLYLVREDGRTTPLEARAGIPSQERLLDDPETANAAGWSDTDADRLWTTPDPERLLETIDRFHAIPKGTEWESSWAEWLYFNGHTADTQFYLAFLVGAATPAGRRPATVSLQLHRNGRMEVYRAFQELTEEDVMRAPNLAVGGNRVRVAGRRYDITLELQAPNGHLLRGQLALEGLPGRHVPPFEARGARGWRSGYVVPVLTGRLDGSFERTGEVIRLENALGYHDHNWGFWEGVSWQWGQVHHEDLSIVYGRIHPPREAADPERIPGVLAALGAEGVVGYATRVSVDEIDDEQGTPAKVVVTGRGNGLQLTLELTARSTENSRMQGVLGSGMRFIQMRGIYQVQGRIGSRRIRFDASGSAETFRGAAPMAAAQPQ